MSKEDKPKITSLLLAVTGSIGVISIPNYIRLFRQKVGVNIHVIMSRSSQKFITPYTMRIYSGNYVFVDTFDIDQDVAIPHLELARKSDLFLIMPATANIMGKIANGICDDLISTAAVASRAPVLLVPNMNPDMWESKVVKRNAMLLKEAGFNILEPTELLLQHSNALVDIGAGSKSKSLLMPSFDSLVEHIEKNLGFTCY